jgi:SAM-dependent methyltransferase
VKNQADFDAVADSYDATFTHTRIGRMLRKRVWQILGQYLPKQGNVLELNCGTGEDALWLAQHGYEVLATDISREMIRLANHKITRAGLSEQVDTRVITLPNLSGVADFPTQCVFSNFGGLNCLSPEDLLKLGHEMKQYISTGAVFIAVVMGRFCLWETLYYIGKGNWKQAFRRWCGGPVMANLESDHQVKTWYHSPETLANALPGWKVQVLLPIGFWLPPSYLNPFFEKRPRLASFLEKAEYAANGRFFARMADHYCIVLAN